MKNKKTEYKLFSVFQWKQEQEYLRQQHKNGWKFVKVNLLGFYHFERCKPEDVIYQLDYNPEGTSHKEQYVQMFRDCGWEYLQDYVGYSYFRKPALEANGAEEIFCDDDSRLDFMKRVFKGRLAPLITMFFCIIIPQLFLQPGLGSPLAKIFTGLLAGLGIIYLVIFLSFGFEFLKYKKSLKK